MGEIVHELFSFIFTDPTHGGMIAIMMLVTLGALFLMERKDRESKSDMKDLIDQFQKQNDENRKDLMEIIEKYQEGQINVIQAINEIKILLATIGAKL
jgi:DNA-directed RNA polymerase beta' subunit